MFSRRWLFLLIPLVCGVVAVVVLVGLPASAQSSSPSATVSVDTLTDGILPASPDGLYVILYDQYNHENTSGVTSQNFEESHDDDDDFAADDFIVPDSQEWHMSLVDVAGTNVLGPGPVDSFNVFIYTQAITLPGTLVASRYEMSFDFADPNYAININPTIGLKPGKYWISVQANESFSTNGQWFWISRSVTSNYIGAWQNPGDGFGSGCTTWNSLNVCLGSTPKDLVFRLSGTVIFPACGNPSNWVVRSSLPESTEGSAVVNDGIHVYSIGGQNTETWTDITGTLRYDPLPNKLITLAPVPHAVTFGAAEYAPVNQKIYVFGGQSTEGNNFYNTTLIYDIASNTWTIGTPMPEERVFMAHGYYEGKIYLAGGYNSASINPSFNQLWEYDVLSDTWITKTNMPAAFGGPASGVVNGYLYVIGGRDASNNYRDQILAYNIALDSWEELTKIPYTIYVPGTALLDGKIWVIGGFSDSMGQETMPTVDTSVAQSTRNTTLIYDPATDTWTNGPAMVYGRAWFGATGIGNFAYALGGEIPPESKNIEIMGPCWAYLPVLMGEVSR